MLAGILLIVFAIALAYFVAQGAPSFVPTHRKSVEDILGLAGDVLGKRVVDLGSGDGRIVIALAKAGAEAHGYEINPFLVWQSRHAIKKAGLSKKACIHFRSFWSADLSLFSVVTVFGIPHIMQKLGEKLSREMKPGAKVISYVFPFQGWHPVLHDASGVYVYVVQRP